MSLGTGSIRGVDGLGDGSPLPRSLRGRFERAFDADLGRVRVHTGPAAAAAAADAGARAFTLGDDVVFAAGAYRPGANAGDWLIGHELAHVAQTRAGAGVGSEARIEADARTSATAALLGLPARPQQAHDGRLRRRFGAPENVPDLTYISTQGGPGFLNQATAYHRAWGLNPRRVASIEEVVTHLARGRGRVGRIRIVTHAAQLGPYISLFRRQPLVSLQAARLRAWATSDVAGLGVDLGYPFGQLTATQTARILTHLRTNHAPKIAPFNLGATTPPTGALAELLQRATDLELLTQSRTAANAAQIDPLLAATRTILADIRGRVATQGSITPVQAQVLETAIRGAGLLSTGYTPTAHQTGTVREANRAVAGGFRAALTRARARFDADSWIDLRGCNAGRDRANLVALQEFFGRANNLPHVSAPDWFQQFLAFAYASLRSDAAIDAAMADASFAAALNRWAVITGIRAEVEALRLFYTAALARRALAAAAPPTTGLGGFGLGGGPRRGPFPSLSLGGRLTPPRLPLPPIPVTSSPADQLLVDLILQAELGAISRLRVPPLRSPRFAIAPNLALADPLTPIIRRALASLTAATGEARFYFHSPHVLPVYRAGIGNFRLYYLQRLRELAFDRWLDSQWTSAPPGLRAIKRQAATQTDPRRIQAVVPQRQGGLDQMLFPPDPRYWQHIIRI